MKTFQPAETTKAVMMAVTMILWVKMRRALRGLTMLAHRSREASIVRKLEKEMNITG